MEILKKCNQGLSDDQFLSNLEFSEDELKKISGFGFYTLKPIIIALNLGEEQFKAKLYPQKDKLVQVIGDCNIITGVLSAHGIDIFFHCGRRRSEGLDY